MGKFAYCYRYYIEYNITTAHIKGKVLKLKACVSMNDAGLE